MNPIDTVRRASDAPAPYAADLERVRRRAAARRKRRLSAAAAGAAALATVAVATVPALVRDPAAAPPVQPAAAPSTAAPSTAAPSTVANNAAAKQRVVLPFTLIHAGKGGMLSMGTGGQGEVLPDGSLRAVTAPDVDHVEWAVALPDGRLVTRGLVDLMPGVQREDGPYVEGVSFPLVVLRPDASVEVRRELRVVGEYVRLVGATATHAYLLRDDRLVTHDLASGAERVLLADAPAGAIVDVQAGTAVFLDTDRLDTCPITAVDLATGRPRAVAPIAANCTAARLSPDGSRLAVASTELDQDTHSLRETTVTVLDTRTGAVLAQAPVDTGRPTGAQVSGTYGIGWSDPRTVRVVWGTLPPDADPPSLASVTDVVTSEVVVQ